LDGRFFCLPLAKGMEEMIKPQLEEAKKYFGKYTVIPVCKEIFADIKTSVEVVKNFMEKNKKSFLLESVGSSRSWGRYSFIGYNPKFTVKCADNKVFIESEEKEEIITNDPVTLLWLLII
jgi:anthranilate synthase component 1